MGTAGCHWQQCSQRAAKDAIKTISKREWYVYRQHPRSREVLAALSEPAVFCVPNYSN